MLRFTDPITGKRISKSSGTRSRNDALIAAESWRQELESNGIDLYGTNISNRKVDKEFISEASAFIPMNDAGYVYFLFDCEGNKIRIGKSKSYETTITRLGGEMALIPGLTRVYALMHGAGNEDQVHRLLSGSRIRHSWYAFNDQVEWFIRRHAYVIGQQNWRDVLVSMDFDKPAELLQVG